MALFTYQNKVLQTVNSKIQGAVPACPPALGAQLCFTEWMGSVETFARWFACHTDSAGWSGSVGNQLTRPPGKGVSNSNFARRAGT